MKATICHILLLLLTTPALRAQDFPYPKIKDTEITALDSVVRLSFSVEADRRLNRKGTTAVFVPQITDGVNTVCFPPVVAEGRRSQVAWERHQWAAGFTADYGEAVYLKRGEAARYRAEVQLQEWMHGADLSAVGVIAGCCSVDYDISLLASNVLALPEPEPELNTTPESEMEPVLELPELTGGDQIAEVFSFVLPSAEFDPVNPSRLYDDERENEIVIYFHINRYDIDQNYADNRQMLSNLIAAIDLVMESTRSRVSRIVVAGFASPDGPFHLNDRLAWERAVSVKEYIMKNTGLPDGMITIYNGSADWQGLRLMVMQDRTMPGREEVLEILDNYPVWDAATNSGRNTRIRQLHGGEVYRYMARHIFPKLRNGAFIRVYYENNTED